MFNYPVINTGGHYDPATGIYTVSIDDIYEFIFQFRTSVVENMLFIKFDLTELLAGLLECLEC